MIELPPAVLTYLFWVFVAFYCYGMLRVAVALRRATLQRRARARELMERGGSILPTLAAVLLAVARSASW